MPKQPVRLCFVTLICWFVAANPSRSSAAPVTFNAPQRDFGVTESGSSYVITGDINKDGFPDVLATGFGGQNGLVSIFFNNGKGSLTAGPILPLFLFESVNAMALADLNQDGNLDLIAGSESQLVVLLGNSDGTFQSPITYQESVARLAIGDFNGDGKLDVITLGNKGISVYFGNGNGSLEAPVVTPTPNGGNNLALSDFNNDGKLDIAIVESQQVAILLGDGDGNFSEPLLFGLPFSDNYFVAVGDFNEDGRPDIAIGLNDGGTVQVLLGNGDGNLHAGAAITLAFKGSNLAVGDFNKDGKLDIVACGSFTTNESNVFTGLIDILTGNGDGTFANGLPQPVGFSPYTLSVADFNQDGNLDAVTGSLSQLSISLVLGDGHGAFVEPSLYALGRGAKATSIAKGDLSGNGHVDLVLADSGTNTISVFAGNGDGTFQPAATFLVGTTPQSVVLGDLNGDGKIDAVTANAGSNNLSVLLGNGDGTFQAAQSIGTGTTPRSVAIGDLNGDGNLDVVAAGSGGLNVFLGKGDGTFTPWTLVATGASNFVALADVNHDGKLDVVTSSYNREVVLVLLGNGDGTFGKPFVISGFGLSLPDQLAVADMNGDGKPDLVIGDGENVSVALGNGDGTFQAFIDTFVGFATDVEVSVADFNADGILDVAASSLSTGVSILIGNGDGTFQPPLTYGGGTAPSGVVTADFNHDGRPDVAVLSAQAVSILLSTTR